MSAPQIIKTNAADELVILSRHDYDVLLARAGDTEAENSLTAAILAEARENKAATGEIALPVAVWEQIEAGENAVKIIRQHRGITQTQLAQMIGCKQGYISKIEGGPDVLGTIDTLRALATALSVPLEALTS